LFCRKANGKSLTRSAIKERDGTVFFVSLSRKAQQQAGRSALQPSTASTVPSQTVELKTRTKAGCEYVGATKVYCERSGDALSFFVGGETVEAAGRRDGVRS
jgi:hypothetical protein